jgi:heptosyltransferase II
MLRNLLRLIDRGIGFVILVLCLPLIRVILYQLSDKVDQKKEPKTFLIIKMVGMGDAVMALTVVDCLKREMPNSKIIALTTPITAGIWEKQPCFNKVIDYDILGDQKGIYSLIKLVCRLRKEQIDCVIDFEPYVRITAMLSMFTGAAQRIGFYYGNSYRKNAFTDPVELNPKVHRMKAHMALLAPLGIQMEIHSLKPLHVTEEDRVILRQWLRNNEIHNGNRIVVIHPGSGERGKTRRWPEESFIELTNLLLKNSDSIVIVCGSEKEKSLTDSICSNVSNDRAMSVAGELPIRILAALLCQTDLFIGNDTGPMHLAAAMGTPTIGLFGPETPVRYGPFGGKNINFYGSVPCSPCISIHLGQVPDCHQQRPICMAEIKPNDVWKGAQKILT